eukprot:2926738-Alexandrium_andersonii.AAC.1
MPDTLSKGMSAGVQSLTTATFPSQLCEAIVLDTTQAQVSCRGASAVSYTHLTLPTICSV